MSTPARQVTVVNLPDVPVRIGYHRRSDDSVSSSVWVPGSLRNRFVDELIADRDVDQAWWRTSTAMPATYVKGRPVLKARPPRRSQ